MTNDPIQDYHRMVKGVPVETGRRILYHLGNAVRGAYHGAAVGAVAIPDGAKMAFDDFLGLNADFSNFAKSHGARVPLNATGVVSAAVGGLGALALECAVLYNMLGGFAEVMVN